MTDLRLNEEEIFQVACDLASEESRKAYLNQVCGDDERLKERVLTLLRADLEHRNLEDTAECRSDQTKVGDANKIIGPYKILQEIGKGGMGVVYMAEQIEPVKRRVALKLVKPGLDTDQVVARFEAERQALAMMDHPNIAKVLDAGATEDGRPFFVMELVKGVPITQYCDEHRLNARERLQLYVSVCRGVQHAHMKGVIHRDLKPSNVLITEYDHQPVAKIIDFGVAKATNQELTEKTMFTQFGQIIGTLDYMSPEQAKFNQLDIDTRSDVYSLGVLLYELLTGETPIKKEQLQESGLEELLRIIREDEPPRPSTRVGSSATLPHVATNRNTDPRKLIGQLRDDLDWIVVKAMSKERRDRYQSAEMLAEDIQRHLADLPITARRPSIAGRMKRLVRRHRTVASLSGLALLATAAAIMLGFFAHIAQRRERVKSAELVSSRRTIEQVVAEKARVASIADQQKWARESIPKAHELFSQGRVVDAFQLAGEIREILPNDSIANTLWNRVKKTVSIDLKPQGILVEYRDAFDKDASWTVVGTTPITDLDLPQGELRLRLSKDGYVTRQIQHGYPIRWNSGKKEFLRVKTEDWQENMTFVEGAGARKLWRLAVGNFFIDKYEVTNSQFQKFVDAGAYQDESLWEGLEFIADGKPVPWKEAMKRFVDASGVYGPATWHAGRYPVGKGNYPIGGVSWYEAVAFANFSQKQIPTVHHWRRAAETKQAHILTTLSNFSSQSPDPVGANDGIGQFEVYDLGGNVREWCWNEGDQGRRCLTGGAWDDNTYQFGSPNFESPWDRNPRNGFRCVRYEEEPKSETLAGMQLPSKLPLSRPEPDPVATHVGRFDYDRKPLNVELIQSDDQKESPDFRHEIVCIDAAYGNERFNLHLLIPRQPSDRYETAVFFPGLGFFTAKREFQPYGIPDWSKVEAIVRSGRMVCFPVYHSTFERWNGRDFRRALFLDEENRHETLEHWVRVIKDLRRAVDYLETRSDVRQDRLLYYGVSIGAMSAPVSLVVEPRLKAGVLISGGYGNFWEKNALPEMLVTNYAPYVEQPVLMISGEWDNVYAVETNQVPLFKDLPCPLNEHQLVNRGHLVLGKEVAPRMDRWLKDVFEQGASNDKAESTPSADEDDNGKRDPKK